MSKEVATVESAEVSLYDRLAAMGHDLAPVIESIPMAGADGEVSIVLGILAAGEAVELDKPWRSDGLGDYVGKRLRITDLRRHPSDYDYGWPFFLLVGATDLETGEKVVITTGSVAVVAQLVKAYALGALPWDVIPRAATRPSANGFYPQHLEVAR